MNRSELMRKIRACLRLSTSANENEAATALRHARALMEKHGISMAEAMAGDVSECVAKTARRGKVLHESLQGLIWLVERMFRCRSVVSCGVGCPVNIIFYGTGADAEIAAYAFEVLRNQMDSACRKHISRVRVRLNREARGEAFRRGWVFTVGQLMGPTEPELTVELAEKLQAYKAARWQSLAVGSTKALRLERAKAGDFSAGVAAGNGARLHSGIGGTKQAALEHHS